MPTARKPTPKPKKVSPAEKKRREMAKKPAGKKKASPLAKKKISNAEAAALLKKEMRARKLKRTTEAFQKGNKPGRQNRRGA